MKLKVLLLAIMAVCIIGCSTDDNFIEQIEDAPIRFTVIGEDNQGLLELTYNSDLEELEVFNLTSQLPIEGVFLTLRQVENTMSYYSFSNGNFSLALKDMDTGVVDLFSNITNNSIEKSIAWGINSKETVHFGFFSPSGSTNVGLRNIDIPTLETNDLQIDFNVANFYDPLYHNQKLFITYQHTNQQNKVQVYNIENKAFITRLDFGSYSPSLLINDDGNLAIIKSQSGIDSTLEIYDFDSLNLITSSPLPINRFFSPGALDATLINDKLYYSATFTQPSPIIFGPAFYDIVNEEDNVLNLVSIINQVQNESGEDLSITVQGYSRINNQFYIGYIVANSIEGNKGGVLVISEEGELLDTISVPFAPIYFLKD